MFVQLREVYIARRWHHCVLRLRITTLQTTFSSKAELELHNSHMLIEMRSLFKFCQGAAHIWDVHELGLAKQERALHEQLDECRHQHDNENQVSTTRGATVFTENTLVKWLELLVWWIE